MAIEYRSVDADATRAGAKKQHSAAREEEAFAVEVETERLNALNKQSRTKEEKAVLKQLLEANRADVKARRARAHEAAKEAPLTNDETTAVRRDFLNRWIASLEQEHIGHEILISNKEAALQLTGDAALSEEETQQAMAEIKNSRDSLETIEASWNVATAKLDALNAPPKPPKKAK